MTSVIPARRRAEEFAALVDGGGDASGTRHDDLVELVTALRGTPLVAPRADYVADLRAALMAEAETALSAVDTRLTLPLHPRTRRDKRFAIAAGTVALLGAGTSMAVASQDALPGDALYPVKRVIEGARSTLQLDELSRAETLLANASGRLDEVSALQARDTTAGRSQLPTTLDDFSTQARNAADVILDEYSQGGGPAPVTDLRQFTSDSMDTLVRLGGELPSSARTALERAARVLKDIDDRAAAACPECGGGIEEVPPMFLRSFSDGVAAPTTVSTAPPVVITPVSPPRSPAPGGKGDGSTPAGDGSTPDLPGTDGGTGAGDDPVGDVTKKVLGDKPAKAPKNPLSPVTDPVEDDVVDPLLGAVDGLGDDLLP